MSKSNPKIKELEKIIIALDTAFEVGDECINPFTNEVVLDNEYDAFKQELFTLNPKSKIFKSITSSTAKTTKKKIVHNPPMTSINKCNGDQAEKQAILIKWIKDSQKHIPTDKISKDFDTHLKQNYSMSYKHDGLALSCEYVEGELQRVGLRSKSGKDGIDVTSKAKYIDGIPQKLPIPITCTIRGEVETPISVFNKVSEELGDEAKVNPRAHTAGSMNCKTAEKMKDRGLRFVSYNILNLKDPPYKTEIKRAEWVTKTLKLHFVKTVPFTQDMLKLFEEQHHRLDFKVDGVVISVNNLDYQKQLGNSGDKNTGNPKGKIAFKFKDEIKKVIVKDIVWQTGRTGSITPVLIFDGVQLEGTTVSKCTAHNLGVIKSNKIGIGSEIEIIKSGKIIPKIHKVIKCTDSVSIPTNCPSCNNPTKVQDGNKETQSLICTNKSSLCPAQNVQKFNHYLKRINVKGIADSTINKLCEGGLVSELSDFYKLTLDKIQSIGIQERSAILILARIKMIDSPEQEKDGSILLHFLDQIKDKKVPISMDLFISALGVDGAGKELGRILTEKYDSFDIVRSLSKEDLEGIDGIGPIIANNVYDYFNNCSKQIDNLLEFVKITIPEKKSGKLEGKTFVLSGKLENGKAHWKTQIEKNGGTIKGSVGRSVTYLVAGEGSGSKSKKAQELGVEILDIEKLTKLLNN